MLNSDGTGVQYTYQNNAQYASERNRVVKVTQLYNSTTTGGTVSISYGTDNTTTITTDTRRTGNASTDRTTETRVFSNIGQLTSVVTPDGCSTYTYKTSKSDEALRNKVASASSAQTTRRNYVKNHNIESGTANWVSSNWSGAAQSVGLETANVYLGKNALRVTKTEPAGTGGYCQDNTGVAAGSWCTLSAYVKVSGVKASAEGGGAGVYASFWKYTESGGLVRSGPNVLGQRITENTSPDGWDRMTVTFQVPAGTDRVSVYGGITDATGTAYFDCFQLENAVVASDYNLLTNPTFHTASDWTMSSGASYVIDLPNGFHRAYIVGNQNENRRVSQSININKANLSFRISGKAGGAPMATGYETGGSVPIAYPRYFALDLGIFYANGDSEYKVVPFNPDSTGEQFVTKAVQTKKDVVVNSVTFYAIYYRNANRVWFDDLCLNLDATGTAYDYDDTTGNLKSASDNAQNRKTYEYNEANELLTMTDEALSESYSYTYDTANQHRLVAARSNQTGIGFRYGYNTVGGVNKTQMGTLNTSGVLDTAKPYLQTEQAYNDGANYVNRVYDQRGKLTSSAVGHLSGLVYSTTDPKGNTVSYTYDSAWRMTGASSGNASNSYAYDSQSRLSSITHNGFQYAFTYDALGNQKTVSVKNGSAVRQLISNTYWPHSGLLKQATYGNGDTRHYSYNKYGQMWLMQETAEDEGYLLWNEYDASGTLAVSHDNAAGQVHYYQYDLAGRLEARNTSPYSGSKSSVRYQYDNQNRLTGETYVFSDKTYTNTYFYGVDSRLISSTMFGGYSSGGVGAIAQHGYDTLGREYRTSLVAVPMQYALVVNRTYVGVEGNRTTTLVDNYKAQAQKSGVVVDDTYTYDANGNIASITDKDGQTISYRYDGLNQLIWENNPITGKMTTYAYNAGGNLLSRQEYPYSPTGELVSGATGLETFSYGDSTWKDLLTAYKGQSITYDAIGNPLTYRDEGTFTM